MINEQELQELGFDKGELVRETEFSYRTHTLIINDFVIECTCEFSPKQFMYEQYFEINEEKMSKLPTVTDLKRLKEIL